MTANSKELRNKTKSLAFRPANRNGIFVGIDLGGTKIVAIVMDGDGKLLGRKKCKTDVGKGLEGIADTIHNACDAALAGASITWGNVTDIGIAVPSSVDPETGAILHAPNLGLKNQPARDVFEKVFGRNVFVGNDVNCGMLAECRYGAARGCRSAVGFFVGTGLGGGIVIDGKLVQGVKGMGGEVGHMIVHHKGRLCGCGNRGCLEAYCSKIAFGKRFDKLIRKKGMKSVLTTMASGGFSNIKSRVLANAYRLGDDVVRSVLDRGASMLGVATANVIALLGSEIVIYGGGVMEELGDELLPIIRKNFEAHLFGLDPSDVKLAFAELKGDAVAVGAAVLALSRGIT